MRPSAFSSWGDHSEGQHEAPTPLRLSQGPEDSSLRGYLLASLATNLSVPGAQCRNLGEAEGLTKGCFEPGKGSKEIQRNGHKRGDCSCIYSINRHRRSCFISLSSADTFPFQFSFSFPFD